MQNNNSLRKWTELQGMAAVCINTGKKEGTIEDFYFDPPTNTVLAFLVKTGLFGHRALLSSSINAIGVDAITFTDDTALIKESSDTRLKSAPLGRTLLTYRVMSEGGNMVGNIGNMQLDTSTPTAVGIVVFELSAGLRARLSNQYPSFLASQVTRYGQDVLVIPDSVAGAINV